MLQTLFYACLRASELCNLNDEDLDLNGLTIRIRGGKGGIDGMAYITSKCAKALHQYLTIKPPVLIDKEKPLFFTDYGRRWNRTALYRMFAVYKKKAGIEKKGGLHVFSRHSAASILAKNRCDLRSVQALLRHRDINTTLRYTHLSDKTKREKYEQYLRL